MVIRLEPTINRVANGFEMSSGQFESRGISSATDLFDQLADEVPCDFTRS